MQVISVGSEGVRERGLEKHIKEFRADKNANASSKSRTEVLHQAEFR